MGDVLGWLWFLIPLGVGVLALKEYRVAKMCFAVSGILLAWKVIMEIHTTSRSTSARMALAFVVCGIIGAVAVYSWSWVDLKRQTDNMPSTGESHSPVPSRKTPPAPTKADKKSTLKPTSLKATPRFPGFKEMEPSSDELMIRIGGNYYGFSRRKLKQQHVQMILPVNHMAFPIWLYIEKGVLYADAILMGPKGTAFKVIKNEFQIQDPQFDRNYNQTAFEVVMVADGNKPVFQLIHKDDQSIEINGSFMSSNAIAILTHDGTTYCPLPCADLDAMNKIALKPIFKYPSWKYLGQYAD